MKPLCVLGIVDNEKGKEIAREMLSWLREYYEVECVYHDGSKFEQPALRRMQELCIEKKRPCLYLHTKGAYNRSALSSNVREMWRHEFTFNQALYFALVSKPYSAVACPFAGSDKTTWYNGFVANWQAMAEIPPIMPSENRKKYERLFRGSKVQVFGTIRNDLHRNPETCGHIDEKAMEAWNLIRKK